MYVFVILVHANADQEYRRGHYRMNAFTVQFGKQKDDKRFPSSNIHSEQKFFEAKKARYVDPSGRVQQHFGIS